MPWDPFAASGAAHPCARRADAAVRARRGAPRGHRPALSSCRLSITSRARRRTRRPAGPNRWNRQQGLYVYRRDRLIQSGGWNRLRTLDEHSKLARIAIDIPPDADAAFRINVSKMTVGLPEALRPQLRALVAGVVSRRPGRLPARLARSSDGATAEPGERETELTIDHYARRPVADDPRGAQTAELGDQPELLDRLLVDARERPPVATR